MGDRRPVLVRAKEGVVRGTFHGFYQFSERGNSIPVAVIEFEDGQVGMIAPDRMSFADVQRPPASEEGSDER